MIEIGNFSIRYLGLNRHFIKKRIKTNSKMIKMKSFSE